MKRCLRCPGTRPAPGSAPIIEAAVAAALVLAHQADQTEAHLGVAADRLSIGNHRVNRDPVMTALLEHWTEQLLTVCLGLGRCSIAQDRVLKLQSPPGSPGQDQGADPGVAG